MSSASYGNGVPQTPGPAPSDAGRGTQEGRPELPTTTFIRKAIAAAEAEKRFRERTLRANPVTSTMDYSPEELEFLKEVDAYKRQHCKSFLTNTEMFAILTVRLGYARRTSE